MGNPFPELVRHRLMARITVSDLTAFVLYAGLAVYLYLPELTTDHSKAACGFNSAVAALGAYFMSKRWVNNWTPLFFTGAAYGFGPFALSFGSFLPSAGLSFAMLPWLLMPAVYWRRDKAPDAFRFCVRATLTLLPFAWIILLFRLSSQQWAGYFYMMMPQKLSLIPQDFLNLILPLHTSGGVVVFGLYHGSIVFALMGLFVYLKLQRIALLIPIAAGLVLAFCEPILQVSPIVWSAFPILFLAVLCGLGFQAFLWAGKADMKWILTCALTATVLAAFCAGIMVTPFAGRVFELSAIMYALAAAALWTLLSLIQLNLRWAWFKWFILTAAIAIDLLYSARHLVDKF